MSELESKIGHRAEDPREVEEEEEWRNRNQTALQSIRM